MVSDWLGKKESEEISQSDGTRIVLFAARWCGYCDRFLKTVESFKASDQIQLYLVDSDDPDESLWDIHKIRLVPTLVVFRSGRELFRRDGISGVGLRSKDLDDAIAFLAKSA
ncbi:MAG: thioredoxin family protein [Nitrososphaerota archaeon]|nr:thioredoxin family protein [Nitrososphaerota archaeon]